MRKQIDISGIWVEVSPGANLEEVKRQAVIVAMENNVEVEFLFNDKHWIVNPDKVLENGVCERE